MPPSQSNPLSTFLRNATILAFPIGFILGLVHGIITLHFFPAFSSLPLFASFLLALLIHPYLSGKLTYGGSPITLSPSSILCCDLLLLFVHFLFLLLALMNIPTGWGGNGPAMVGTFATVPGFVCVGVHGWFVVRDVGRAVQHSRECDECTLEIGGHPSGGHHSEGHGRGGDYTPLTTEEYEEVEEGRRGERVEMLV